MNESKNQNSIIGQKFNRLTVIGEAPHKVFPSGRKTQVVAICECGIEGHLRGEKFTASGSTFKNATINEQQAVEIYLLAHEGVLTQKEIAARFNVIQSQVSAIKRGASWAEATKEVREIKSTSHPSTNAL